MVVPPPLSLYLHIPWCVRKCPYCDFNSHPIQGEMDETEYVDALIQDLEYDLPYVQDRSVNSIYIGGGTPSLFSPHAIDRLLSGVRARLPLSPHLEITLEANPGAVEHGRFAGFRAVGVNRVSIGIQSFNREMLQRLGRIHDDRAAIDAVKAAQTAGFENINLDLMFGIPSQTLEQAIADVVQAIELGPVHISHYELTIEDNTLFSAQPPPLPDDDLVYHMQKRCWERLTAAGYIQYEVSAYSRPGKHSRHNLNYWQFGDYLGIGAGAHAKITRAGRQDIVRLWKVRHPRQYLRGVGSRDHLGGISVLDKNEVVFEFLMNALRLTDGFPSDLFLARTGCPVSLLREPLAEAMARGLIEWDQTVIRPTRLGRKFLNDLLVIFAP